ncbi:MAG TPA: DUF1844 domain-containing protein [Thermoanaerobaculia bacterium]|nr:DUF1844 domain-containing protein [Thermoanaerobaculia bacterium]
MPEENKPAQPIKVTDRRLFTADGEIREEFRDSVKPADPNQPRPEPPKQAPPEPPKKERKVPEADPASESMFMNLIELLVYQASVALGSQQLEGARQLIDIVDMLAEKTAGNLTPSEQEFLESRRGALKLAYVQRTKRI